MNTKIENIGNTRKKIVVTFDAAEVSQERQNTLKDFLKSAKIPGFRPGKAPLAMVEKLYSKDIEEYASRALTSKGIEALNAEKDLELFSVVDLQKEEKDGIVTLTFTADVYPAFELPKDLKTVVELPKVEVTEDEIKRGADYYLNQRANYEVVDRAIQKGDFVRLSYDGKSDGKEISEIAPEQAIYGKQLSTWEEAGNAEAPGIQSIVQGIIGLKAGDKKVITHEFPAEFDIQSLAGKTAQYDVEIFEVREKRLPALDEEFLKAFEVATKEEFEGKIKDEILAQKNSQNEIAKRQKAVEVLMEGLEIELPESAVEEEKNAILEEMMMRFMSSGASRQDLEKNKELLFDTAAKDAGSRAKLKIFLTKVAKANDIKVDNEDMSRLLWQEAMRLRIKPDELVKQLKKDQAKVNRMRADALIQKAINFIAEKAEVKLVEGK